MKALLGRAARYLVTTAWVVIGGLLLGATAGELRAIWLVPPTPPEISHDLIIRNAKDAEGRNTSFRILLFTDEFRWRLNSFDAIERTGARPHFTDEMKAVLNSARDELIEAIADLQQQLTGLERHVDRIRWAAVRQTRYLRILASIEQAHLHGQGGAVEAVIHAMRRLDDRISALEEEARDRVEKVQGLMNSFCRMIWPPRAVLEAV